MTRFAFPAEAAGGVCCAKAAKTGGTVSGPWKAKVEAVLTKWNGKKPKALARQDLAAVSEKPTSALVDGIVASCPGRERDFASKNGRSIAVVKIERSGAASPAHRTPHPRPMPSSAAADALLAIVEY